MILAISRHVVVPCPERNGATALSKESGAATQGQEHRKLVLSIS